MAQRADTVNENMLPDLGIFPPLTLADKADAADDIGLRLLSIMLRAALPVLTTRADEERRRWTHTWSSCDDSPETEGGERLPSWMTVEGSIPLGWVEVEPEIFCGTAVIVSNYASNSPNMHYACGCGYTGGKGR